MPDLIDVLRAGLDAAYDDGVSDRARAELSHRSLAVPEAWTCSHGPVNRATRFPSLAKSTDPARRPDTVRSWTRSGTPTPPAPGQRPPELAGRDRELQQFEVTLERVAAGPPGAQHGAVAGCAASARPCCSTRCAAWRCKRAWGTGKIEARPDQSLRLPLAQAVHAAVREVAHRHRDPDRVDAVAGRAQGVRAADRAQGPQGVVPLAAADRRAATKGRADSGDLELDLIELFTDVADLAA